MDEEEKFDRNFEVLTIDPLTNTTRYRIKQGFYCLLQENIRKRDQKLPMPENSQPKVILAIDAWMVVGCYSRLLILLVVNYSLNLWQAYLILECAFQGGITGHWKSNA